MCCGEIATANCVGKMQILTFLVLRITYNSNTQNIKQHDALYVQ
jgi:hypothetical protein